jgi:hypothetical protein
MDKKTYQDIIGFLIKVDNTTKIVDPIEQKSKKTVKPKLIKKPVPTV